MELPSLIWFTALAITLHNAEEMLWLPRWHGLHRGRGKPMDGFAFRFAAALLSVVVLGFAALASQPGTAPLFLPLLAGFAGAMMVNAFLPHLALSLRRRSYMPGLGTAFALVLPSGLLLWQALLAQGVLRLLDLLILTLITGLPMLASLPLLFWLGRRVKARLI